jgi:2-phospho-L-lactate guanylyltransferase
MSGPRIVAIVPVGTLEGAKSRLGGTLDAEERRDLAARLLDRTVRAVVATPAIVETLVITPDDDARSIALEAGARPIRQRGQGLNQGLREARGEAVAAGAEAVLVVPIDLVGMSSAAIADLLATLPAGAQAAPTVALVPDRHGRGTNALLVAPPEAIEFEFGGDSRAAHRAAAEAAGARYVELDGPLTIDLDTPDDLLLAEGIAPDVLGRARLP